MKSKFILSSSAFTMREDLFKIHQQREKELLKIQQERKN